ncbi:hypothetical protein HZS_6271 [Henneguya salminicola]|nr:hypothetical protein HZS_6271 [Henneguya salminicola]
MISFPYYKYKFTLATEAGLVVVGGILTKNDKIIESTYHYSFKNIIFNSKTIVYTVNKNLTFNPEKSHKIVQNWKIWLSEIDYDLNIQKEVIT